MYYEEKIIKGVLHSRTSPYDKWQPISSERLTTMLREANARIKDLEEAVEAATEYLERH